MKKRLILLMMAVLGVAIITNAQSISRQVISSGGGYAEAGNYKLSYTIGESIVGEVETGNFKLTQGFQQGSNEMITDLEDIATNVDYTLYPNPTTDQIQFTLTAEEDIHIELNIIDASGKMVLRPIKTWGSHINETIDVSSLSIGTYFLVVKSVDGKQVHSISFVKN